MKEDYFVGLDIGTNSVGFAATNEEYNVLKLHGKNVIGSHCFDEALSAAERRGFRSGHRRIDRKKRRVLLLNELFDKEICKVDPDFLLRLSESKYYAEDKTINQKNTLFDDINYKDRDYHRNYPTIYHLRKELMENPDKKYDIRLIYLAVSHILKHRGHFLFQGQDFEEGNSFEAIYANFINLIYDELDITILQSYASDIQGILLNRSSRTDKKNKILAIIGKEEKEKVEITNLLVGNKAKLATIFRNASIDETDFKDMQLSNADFEEKKNDYENLLGDRMALINAIKSLYDWMILSNILNNNSNISSAKVESYKKHKQDLKTLKKLIKENLGAQVYAQMFKNEKSINNYCAYIGKSTEKNNKSVCGSDEFYGYIKKVINDIDSKNEKKLYILKEIEVGAFLPKQTIGDNGAIPYKLHLKELEIILKNSAKHYEFLNEKQDGISVAEKIVAIMKFRIPYYVGPLNKNNSQNAWIVKKEDKKIYPWNFEQVVDLEKSGEEFITRMTSRCTYLIGADVIPKDSLLYSKFAVLNEINNLRINDEKIDVTTKQRIFNELCLSNNKVKGKDIKNFLISLGMINKDDNISGIDGDVKTSMKSFIDFKQILPRDKFNEGLIEESIKAIVLFGEEKKMIKSRISSIWKDEISAECINKICKLKYSGWGALSREFLTEIYDVDTTTGEAVDIITALWQSNNNLMQLLSKEFPFSEKLEERNAEINGLITKFSYKEIVEPLYCSPAVKRGIWRALNIVKEIEKANKGMPPKKIFIETTRAEGIKGDAGRKDSRKNQLLKLYRTCKVEDDLLESLKNSDERTLRSKKLYLYYTQLGRCIYSGKRINIEELMSTNVYDIDHIYPQSKTKDDSMDNMVLADKNFNKTKSDIYPVPVSFKTNEVLALWHDLYKAKLISKEKYNRLTRSDEFSNAELSGFINRQIVETAQSTKAVAQALNQIYKDKNTEIVYVKSGNVSDFRREVIKRFKVREINDFHHGFDAYLNIVVGNVYNTKFTKNPMNFIKDASYRAYSLRRMYDFKVERNGKIAWIPGENGTIQIVEKTMDLKRLQYTRYPHTVTGEFYKQMPLKKGMGQIPLKTSDVRMMNIEKYGAYDCDATAYFFLVKHEAKKEIIKTIEYVPVRYAQKIEKEPEYLMHYCLNSKPLGLGLINPEILIKKIKKDTLFNINGFPMHISGKSNDRILFKPAVQLVLNKEDEQYIKKLVNFAQRNKMSLGKTLIVENDKIGTEENLRIYDLLIEKNTNPIYSLRPSSQSKTLIKGRDKFISLSVEQQCIAIVNILNTTKCSAAAADLTFIDGSAHAGKISISKNICTYKKAIIINQSPTGLYSSEVDLIKL